MKKIFIRNIFIISLASLFASCSPITQSSNVPTFHNIEPSQTSNLPTSNTPVDITPSPLITQTKALKADLKIQHNCDLNKEQGFPHTIGTLALYKRERSISLLNLSSKEKTLVGKTIIITSAYSNRLELAYIDDTVNKLIIVSPDGEEKAAIPVPDNWIEILGWPDKNNILIGNMPFRGGGSWYPPSSTISLDLSTETYTELLPAYPDIYKYIAGPPEFGRYSYSVTAYDPGLNYVVYPAENSTDTWIALWDITHNSEVIRLKAFFPWTEPVWSNDGLSFVISVQPEYRDRNGNLIYRTETEELPYVGGSDLYNIGTDGKISRLTYLTTETISEESAYAWSNDNNFIAFWLKNSPDSQWDLAILEVKTGEITTYCVGDEDGSRPIYWSPDGNLLVSTIGTSADDNTEIVFIDTQKNTTTLIPSNEVVIGWLMNSR